MSETQKRKCAKNKEKHDCKNIICGTRRAAAKRMLNAGNFKPDNKNSWNVGGESRRGHRGKLCISFIK